MSGLGVALELQAYIADHHILPMYVHGVKAMLQAYYEAGWLCFLVVYNDMQISRDQWQQLFSRCNRKQSAASHRAEHSDIHGPKSNREIIRRRQLPSLHVHFAPKLSVKSWALGLRRAWG